MLILSVAMCQGRLLSLITAFGIKCASIILSSSTMLGLAVILTETAELVAVVHYMGAAYLGWLAYSDFRTAARGPRHDQVAATPRGPRRTGLTGFLLQLSNPKAIFFWLAVASAGGIGNAPTSATVLFIAGAFVISFVGHDGYGTHSMRRTKVTQFYKKTGNLRAVQLLLGHTKMAALSDTLALS